MYLHIINNKKKLNFFEIVCDYYCYLFKMQTILADCLQTVRNQIGLGHAECVYQKAMSLLLQDQNINHFCEFNVPIPFQINNQKYNIGNERIDFLIYDSDKNVHIVELKAITGSILTKNMVQTQLMPSSYTQLLKYIQLKPVANITKGYVINFRQSSSFGNPLHVPIEMIEYDCLTNNWEIISI